MPIKVTGKLRDIERIMRSLEGDGWKSDSRVQLAGRLPYRTRGSEAAADGAIRSPTATSSAVNSRGTYAKQAFLMKRNSTMLRSNTKDFQSGT